MNVICINDTDVALTYNKEYEILSYISNEMVVVRNDSGAKCMYKKFRFKSLSDIRNEKIENLLK